MTNTPEYLELKAKYDSLQNEVSNERQELDCLRQFSAAARLILPMHLSIDAFELVEFLGSGCSGIVLLTRFSAQVRQYFGNQIARTPLVVKAVFDVEETGQDSLILVRYMNECRILSLVPNHQGILHPLSSFIISPSLPASWVEAIPRERVSERAFYRKMAGGKSLGIVMPFGGNPITTLANSTLSLEDGISLLGQLISAVAHLSNSKVVHRDIKGDDVLVVGTTGNFHIKLIDFGNAIECVDSTLNFKILQGQKRWGNTQTCPPEHAKVCAFEELVSFHNADSFAACLTVYSVLLGGATGGSSLLDTLPQAPAQRAALDAHTLPPLPSHLQPLHPVLMDALKREPKERLSPAQILQRLASLI
ncbi:PTEN induced putative kinase 1 [Pelomyxa schiedti]|nr:PTEN induced putative kinase 1 [Pelomyxa schiedti]